jgi:hypothetical protein
MKNTNKLLGIIVLTAAIGFSMAGCWWQEKIPVDDTISGTVTANSSGEIIFGYIVDVSGASLTCSITTNLSGSDKTFSINSGDEKVISGLQANQVVNWLAHVERGFLFRLVEYDEANEVHLIGAMHE